MVNNILGGRRRGFVPVTAPKGNPPVCVIPPVLSGILGVGNTLSCTTGTWTSVAGTIYYRYQWQRNSTDIVGQNNPTYVVQNADLGGYVTCLITAANADGVISKLSNQVRVLGGGGAGSGINNILIGTNLEGSTYYSNNPLDNNLAIQANDNSAYITSYPSNAYLTASHFNAQGQIISLPAGDTMFNLTFQPPEHAGQVLVSWSPANAVTHVEAQINVTVDSVDYVAGTAYVTPSVVQPTASGWGLRVTPNFPTIMTFISAVPVGKTAGLSTNFLAQINQFTSPGATIRTLDRVSANDNQGFYYWAQSNTRVKFPTSSILTAATRNTLNTIDWQSHNGIITSDAWDGRKGDGEPWEYAIARANQTGRPLWRNLPWNASQDYYEGFADYVCANATGPVYVEVANEVWNSGFSANVQARQEARDRLAKWDNLTTLINDTSDPQTLTTTDATTSVSIYDGNLGAGERYAEKTIQVSKWIKARCVANGKPNAIKVVFAWQNTSAATIAGLLDYVPQNNTGTPTIDGTPTKNHVDYVASAPYFLQGTVDPTVPPDLNVLAVAGKDDIDGVVATAASIANVATARGLGYLCYESGQSFYFRDASGNEIHYTTGDTTDTVQEIVQRSPQMYDMYMYYWDRLNYKLPAGSIVNHYANSAGVSGRFGAWGLVEKSTDMELDAATFSSTRPKAQATADFIAGKRKLQVLEGSLYVGLNTSVGTVIGSIKRRTFGSTVTLTTSPANALSIVDSHAEVLQITVADADAVSTAGTIVCTFTETDARDPVGSRSTVINCPVIDGTFWSISKSSSYFTLTNNGLTGRLTGNPNADNLLLANHPANATDRWFDITVDWNDGNWIAVGLASPTANPNTDSPLIRYVQNGTIQDQNNTVLASGLPTWGQNNANGDKIRVRVKNGLVYFAKWVSGSWQYVNGANPTTNSGGMTVTGLDDNALPSVAINALNGQITADFSGWTNSVISGVTWSTVDGVNKNANVQLSSSNLAFSQINYVGNSAFVRADHPATPSQFEMEYVIGSSVSSFWIGVDDGTPDLSVTNYNPGSSTTATMLQWNGEWLGYRDGNWSGFGGSGTNTPNPAGTTITMIGDRSAGTLSFYVNGTLLTTITGVSYANWYAYAGNKNFSGVIDITANFAGPFSYGTSAAY